MSDTWRVLLRVPAPWLPAFQACVEDLADGIAAFELPDKTTWLLEALFVAPPPQAEIAGRVAATAVALQLPEPGLEVERMPEIDWVSHTQRMLDPVVAGRFFVRGSHDRGRAPAGAIDLEIEAGRAFGTGRHETTRGCLLAIERLARRGGARRPLDLGTGSGVLAIAMARLWRVPVAAVDVDAISVETAAENARLNGVGPWLRTFGADGVSGRVRRHGPFDLVVANILAGPLIAMAGDILSVTRPGGRLVLAGLLAGQRREVLAAYLGRGAIRLDEIRLGEWPTLLLRRP